jgi:hypothetical protein
MDLSLGGLLMMARDTISDPRGGARRIMAIDLSMQERWLALLLMAVVSTLLTHLSFALAPPAAQDFLSEAMSSPLRTAGFQAIVLFAGTLAVYRFGRARAGTGSLANTISLMAWLQFILLLAQVAQVVAEMLLPPLAQLIGLAAVALFFWLLTNFVAELHGFRSLGATFLGVLLGMMALAFVLALLLAPFMPAVPGV